MASQEREESKSGFGHSGLWNLVLIYHDGTIVSTISTTNRDHGKAWVSSTQAFLNASKIGEEGEGARGPSVELRVEEGDSVGSGRREPDDTEKPFSLAI